MKCFRKTLTPPSPICVILIQIFLPYVQDQPSQYRLTIYRYAIIVSFSKYR